MIDLTQGTTATVYLALPRPSDGLGVRDLSGASAPKVEIGRPGEPALVSITTGITLTDGTTTVTDGSGKPYNVAVTITAAHLAALGPGLWQLEVTGTISGNAQVLGTADLRVRAQVGT